MTTALLISTYNNPANLELIFRTLKMQTRLPDEVVIADDGSTPETRTLLRRLRRELPMPLIHVWQPDAGFRKSRILNEALRHTSADYIIQIDGDILMHPRFIADHLHLARPHSFIRGSRVRLTAAYRDRALLPGDKVWLPSPFSSAIEKRREKAFRIPRAIAARLTDFDAHPKCSIGCNFSFRREDALRINGYDEHYEGWGEEDQDFALRLQLAGCKAIKPFRLCLAYHLHHPEADKSGLDASKAYAAARRAEKKSRCRSGIDLHSDLDDDFIVEK